MIRSDGPSAIVVRRYGSRGPTVVVLHGGPGAPGSARGLAEALSPRFRVLEPLQRRSGDVALSVERHVQDLAAIAPSPALLVGHSWGAMLGLSFASRYPAAVSRLIIIGCGTYDQVARAHMRGLVQERLGPERCRRVAELEALVAGETSAAVREAALQQLGSIHAQIDSYAVISEEAWSPEPLPVDPEGHAETWQDVVRLQSEGVEPQAFSSIRAPVLMIHGDYDPHPGPQTRDLLRRYIPHLEYLELERCGHEPWRERYARAALVSTLCDWLEQAPRMH